MAMDVKNKKKTTHPLFTETAQPSILEGFVPFGASLEKPSTFNVQNCHAPISTSEPLRFGRKVLGKNLSPRRNTAAKKYGCSDLWSLVKKKKRVLEL